MKDTLTREDLKRWGKNVLIFSSPALLAFCYALQTGGFTFALGAFYSALLAALIDLLRKYSSGVEQTTVNQPTTTTPVTTVLTKVGE